MEQRRRPEELAVPLEREPLEREGEGRVRVDGEQEEQRDRQVEERDEEPVVGPHRREVPARAPGSRGDRGCRGDRRDRRGHRAAGPRSRLGSTIRRPTITRPRVAVSMIIERADPSGQFAARVKKSWTRLPYIVPLVPPTSSGVTYSPT